MAAPSIEVRYEDLRVQAQAAVGDKQIPTVMRTLKNTAKVGCGGGRVSRREHCLLMVHAGACG